MRPFHIVLFIIVLIIFVGVILINLISNMIIYPERSRYEIIIKDLKERLGNTDAEMDELLSIPYEEFNITSNYGYNIYGRLFDFKGDKNIILLHRESRNLIASYKFLRMYRDLGFNVVMFDARYHGKSEGKNYTYGYFERWDLKLITDYITERLGPGKMTGFHGESGGAATALLSLSVDDRIGFAISDSSFTDLLEVMRNLEHTFLHTKSKKLLILINQVIKRKAGFSLADVSPLIEIQAMEVPVLFIHSEKDTIVPAKMSKTLKSFKSGYNDIYIAKDAGHLLGYYLHTEEYESKVKSFINYLESNYKKYGKTYI